MATLFGQRVDPNFDPSGEARKNRLGWVLVLGLPICILYDVLGFPFADRVFQAWLATVLPYGVTFYVNQGKNLSKRWLQTAALATLPVHVLYLLGILWSDLALPELMTKAMIFVPVIAVCSAIESMLFFDRVVGWFKPRDAGGSVAPHPGT